MNDPQLLKSIDEKLSILIALFASSLVNEDGETAAKVELTLNRAGLSNVEIAKITGKKLAAVQKTLQRAKK